jgi:hypothetical protein
MSARQRGLLIVTLRGVEDIADTKRRISGIGGVVAVNFNQLNRKLMVRYEGDEATLQRINSEIKEVLDGNSKSEEETGSPSE